MRIRPIRPGDIVDIVAPASKCDKTELKLALKELRALGLKPRVPKDLFAKSLLFSNSDEVRLKHMKKALYARDSRMIWCVRGGYGALRLIPQIAKWKRPREGKIFLGYSDITTLHAFFNQKWNWPTLHGPLLDRLGRDALTKQERKELLGVLFGRQSQVEFRGLKPLNKAARKTRKIRASVWGGNMAVLQSALGTPAALRPKNHILFFEDIGEKPHRVDRMLSQMEQAGWFKSCRAVIFGNFSLNDSKDRRGLWSDVIARFAAHVKIPVIAGMPVGHGNGFQRTLPLNTKSELRLGSKPSLIVDSGIYERV